jgi:hypothetical protein
MKFDKEYIRQLIDAELEGNLQVLIDPKKKDSFSKDRIHTWKQLVGDRIYINLTENE